MKTRGKSLAQEPFFKGRIYFIFSAVAFHCLFVNVSFGQEIGSYRTRANGNFANIITWETYNGATWQAATVKPNQANDIYIDQGHLLTLTGNEEVKSLFINADTLATQKLNLNSRNLNIYGTLQAFKGIAPGTPSGTTTSINWIGNSLASTITFKGTSRTIIPYNSWSAQSTRSKYSVIFDPNPGAILIVEEAFKSLGFTIKSGTVIQQIDNSVIPGKCATFSFNNENIVAIGAFGDFTIETDGVLISKCNNDIIFRSATLSANLFHIQEGGELILEGTSPQIETANFLIDGKVIFRKNSGTQNFLSKSYTSSTLPLTFHALEIQGSQNVTLPATLSVSGNMSKVGSGSFLTNSSHITFTGNQEQTISGFALTTRDLTVNKSGGKVNLDQSLTVSRNLTMLSGQLDFQNNQLNINTSGSGIYTYTDGSWENLSSFTYRNTPLILTASNSTFPFGDRYHGGIRKVQMLGTSAGGNLSINYTEYKGADFNPGFNDNDIGNTPILYRLFSYFQFSGLSASSNPLELRISADSLIVDQPEDLRLVCTGYAAPGNHIASLDTINLWAIRELTFDDLAGKNFTVGSFRTLSILPVTWLTVSAKNKDKSSQITWSVAYEKDNEKFEIYRSENGLKGWSKIGEVMSKGDTDIPTSYSYIDESIFNLRTLYYQIRQVDYSGKWSWSHVVRLENFFSYSTDQVSISPNPHSHGRIRTNLPENFSAEKTQVLIYSTQGVLISSFNYDEVNFSEKLESLSPGLYLISFTNSESVTQMKWIKQ